MPLLMLKEIPRYECLLQAAARYPALDPSAFEAYLHLLRTGNAVFAKENGVLTEKGISQGRFTVLMLLNRFCNEPSTPASLAEKANVTRATMTGLLDTLEKDGMIERETSAEDRRTVLVKLTPKGEAVLDQILPVYCKMVSGVLSPLTETERHTFVALLQKIHHGLFPDADHAASPLAPSNT